MNHLARAIDGTSPSPKEAYLQGALALAFLAILILAYSYIGLTLPMFLAVFAVAVIFLLPSSDYLGLACIVGLTMVFEKLFALQPLVIGDASYKAYPIDIVMAVAFVALTVNLAIRRTKFRFSWPELAFVLFLAVVGFNMVRGFGDLNAQFETAFSSFKNYLWYPLAYFLTLYVVNTRQRLKGFVKLFMLFAVLLIGFIAYGIKSGNGLWTEYTPLSTEGFRILASTHAFYISIALVFAVSLLASQRLRNVLFSLMIMLIWLVGIIGSMMRHLWLGLAVAVAGLFILAPRQDKKILGSIISKNVILLVTIALFAVLALNLFPSDGKMGSLSGITESAVNRVASFASTEDDTSAVWRMGLWRDAVRQWSASPLVGIGFGKQLSLETYDWRALEDVKNIHNSPLAILVQTGIIGFGLFAGFIVAVIIAAYRRLRHDEELRPYYAGILGATVLFLFCSLFQPYLEANFTGIFLWILLGLLSTSRFLISKNENPSDK